MTRVLIVDDDPVQLRLTAEVARRAGFEPVIATGGEQGLAQLRSDPGIGAMILDLVMPDLDGMAVMETMAREGIVDARSSSRPPIPRSKPWFRPCARARSTSS